MNFLFTRSLVIYRYFFGADCLRGGVQIGISQRTDFSFMLCFQLSLSLPTTIFAQQLNDTIRKFPLYPSNNPCSLLDVGLEEPIANSAKCAGDHSPSKTCLGGHGGKA